MAETHRDEAPRASTERWGAEGYDVAGWCLPTESTGGDFFDFEELCAGACFAVALGDVSGHGLRASAGRRFSVPCSCSATPSARLTSRRGWSPRSSDSLCKEALEDRFVTAFFGILRSDTHQLEYLSAGARADPSSTRAAAARSTNCRSTGSLSASRRACCLMPARKSSSPRAISSHSWLDGFFEWFNEARGMLLASSGPRPSSRTTATGRRPRSSTGFTPACSTSPAARPSPTT